MHHPSDPGGAIAEVSGKASVKNIYLNINAPMLKIDNINQAGSENVNRFIEQMKTALNEVVNDVNYLAG